MSKNGTGTGASATERVFAALDGFRIEVPSWGFANTGTRFGKFTQAGAGGHDRGEVRRRIAGESTDRREPNRCVACAVGPAQRQRRCGRDQAAGEPLWVKAGVNQPQPVPGTGGISSARFVTLAGRIRKNALAHLLDSVEIGRELGSKDVSLWLADGSNYPGTRHSEADRVDGRSAGDDPCGAG